MKRRKLFQTAAFNVATVLFAACTTLALPYEWSRADEKEDLKAEYQTLQTSAWDLTYACQGPYDLIYMKQGDYQAVGQWKGNLPQLPLGYAIKDFDSDGHLELLIIQSEKLENEQVPASMELRYLTYEMYELTDGQAVKASEYQSDIPAFASEDGFAMSYSFEDATLGTTIASEFWQFYHHTADGITYGYQLIHYNGTSFDEVDSYSIAGSSDLTLPSFLTETCGMDANETFSGEETLYEHLPETDLFVKTQNIWTAADYSLWENVSRIVGGSAYIDSFCALPKGIVNRSFGDQTLPQEHSAVKPNTIRPDSTESQASETDTTSAAVSAQTASENCFLYVDCEFGDWNSNDTLDRTIQTLDTGGKTIKEFSDETYDNGINTGGSAYSIWNSPNGLCIYESTYKAEYLAPGEYTPGGKYITNASEIEEILAECGLTAEDIPYCVQEQ